MSRQRLAALAARRWRGSCGENVLLGGAAGQLPPAGRFRGKLTEKASPFPSDVANGHRENWSLRLYDRLNTSGVTLPFFDDIAGTALSLLFQELCAVPQKEQMRAANGKRGVGAAATLSLNGVRGCRRASC